MTSARRNFLKYAAGASAGTFFTPVPWKVLDDVSIWSQNWSWIPRPLQGEITEAFTNCTLCPVACGVKARCVGGQPFQLTGIRNHPLGRPTLCPIGVAAHQVPYAPARIAKGRRMEEAADRIRGAGSILIVDGRPNRYGASEYYRSLAAKSPKWRYAAAPQTSGTLRTFRQMTGASCGFAYDKMRTVLSFGAPVLHGWTMPATLLRRRPDYRLIQIEPSQSRTAAFADRWLAIRPGGEAIVALAIANALVTQKLVPEPNAADWSDYVRVIAAAHPEQAGLRADTLDEIARSLVAESPAIALAPPEPGAVSREADVAIAGLNILLGNRAALSGRRHSESWAELPDIQASSAEVIIADELPSLPPSLLRRPLTPGGTLIAFGALESEITRQADIVIPSHAWLESDEEAPGDPAAPVASLAFARALLPARKGATRAIDFIASLTGEPAPTREEILASVHRLGSGSIFNYGDGTATPVSSMASDKFLEAMSEGHAWIDDSQPYERVNKPIAMLAGIPPQRFLERVPEGRTIVSVGTVMPPVPMLAKLYQESDLYAGAARLRMHSSTAGAYQLEDAAKAVVQTRCGSGVASVRIDETVAPDTIHVEGEPALRLCDAAEPAWRTSAVKAMRRA